MPRPKHDPASESITCPFVVVADTREQHVYTFENLWSGPAEKSPRLIVPVTREALDTGDYSILGHPGIAIERKSKEDLYQSIGRKRANFEGRLARMTALDWAAVMIEAEWYELLNSPPPHTQFKPKSLSRTVQAWQIRFPKVHWIAMPGRAYAESWTFRLLERYWKDQQRGK
jgi:hypothetical protein